MSQGAVRTYGHLFHGMRVSGLEHMPLTGGCVVASNHQSHLDPPILCAFSPRPIHFLAKEELFDTPVVRELITWMGMVRTPRDGGAIAAIRAGVRVIKDGYVLGIFPEGTRSKDGHRQPAQPGVVAIAVMAGNVPIVPAYIGGTLGAMPPGSFFPRFRKPIRIVFGEPFTLQGDETNLKDKARMQQTAERVLDRVFALQAS
ncbi:MAG: lysophospholipid acyltransferase family protein [bacterium]